jgi:large subunit ribosomal protein L13
MRTFMAKPQEKDRKWYLIDADGKPLGRLASEVAVILRGKHKPEFTPHVDVGDHVVVINAEKVKLTGKKLENKFYIWHSRYPGGLKQMSYADLLRTKPERAIEHAVWGMVMHNRLGRQIYRKLRVYRGSAHPHAAQQPEVWTMKK